MNIRLLSALLAATLMSPLAIAQEEGTDDAPMVVYAKEQPMVRVRTSQIRSWSSDDNKRLVLTTIRRDQYLIEFERPCYNLKLGPSSNALITDTSWLDRNGSVRVMNRDHLPFGHLSDMRGGSFAMTANVYSSLCPIKDITALGKKPTAARKG